ncbi:MAG TPA: hypothetical protein VJH55_01460 [Candidatus Paceibacterota bacterium]
MELPRSWGKKFDPEFQRLSTPDCPYCGKALGDMIVDFSGKPDEYLLAFAVGYSTEIPSARGSIGGTIFECPQCFHFCWFHVQEPWALAVAEFAPKSPYFKRVRNTLKGEELEDALMDMNVIT